VTPTLVAVVCMYLVLITPSELLQFYYYAVRPETVELFNTVIVAANVLVTGNFAFNFVLYCIDDASRSPHSLESNPEVWQGQIGKSGGCSRIPTYKGGGKTQPERSTTQHSVVTMVEKVGPTASIVDAFQRPPSLQSNPEVWQVQIGKSDVTPWVVPHAYV